MARPPKYENSERFSAKVNEYLKQCAELDEFPDENKMLEFLSISWDTYDRYRSNEDSKYPGFADSIKKAAAARESWLVRTMLSEPKRAIACMFLLKQQKNGGYSDRPATATGDIEIRLKIDGGGPDPMG